MGKYIDITGEKYGRLTVIEKAESKNGKTRWLCQCDCGNTVHVSSRSLVSGNTKSCGCLLSAGELKIANILRENNIKFI